MSPVKKIKKFFLSAETDVTPAVENPVIEEVATVTFEAKLPVVVHAEYRDYYGMIVTVVSPERIKVRFWDDVLGNGCWRELPFDAVRIELLPTENETEAEASVR